VTRRDQKPTWLLGPDTTCCYCPSTGSICEYGKVSCVLCPVCAFDVDMRSATPGELEREVSMRIETMRCA
jgi:hypothetical protein